jgi:hypothetical protein
MFKNAILVICAFTAHVLSALHAENLPSSHPSSEVVKNYLAFVTEQNWKEAAKYVRPSAIAQKHAEVINALKNISTMSEETAILEKFGVKSIDELKKMPLTDFYAADRMLMHNRGKVQSPEIIKKKRDSLKITVYGIVGEPDGKTVHLVVRTYQEVDDYSLNELIFISAVNEEGKWLVAPDITRPSVKPLKAAAPKPDAGKAAKP